MLVRLLRVMEPVMVIPMKLTQPALQAIHARLQGHAQPAKANRIEAWRERIDIGESSLYLVEDRARIGLREEGGAFDVHVHGAGVGRHLVGSSVIAAPYPKRHPRRELHR